MKSPLMKVLGMVSWVITGFASLHLGLVHYGHDLVSKAPSLAAPFHIAAGVAGLVSLSLLVMMLACGCGKCGTSSCSC